MLFKNKPCEKCGNKYDAALEECPKCHQKDGNFRNLGVPKNVLFLSIWQQILLFLVGFALGGYLLFEIIFIGIFSPQIKDKNTLIFTVICFVYLSIFISSMIVISPKIKHFLKSFKNWDTYLYGVGYAVTIFAFSTLAGILSQYVFGASTNVNQTNINSFVFTNPLLAIFFVGILGPITEELCYRVGLYSLVRRLNVYAAFFVTMFVFAIIHLDFQKGDLLNELQNLPSYLIAGFIFSLAYEHKGPVASMIAHIIYNSLVIIITLLGR